MEGRSSLSEFFADVEFGQIDKIGILDYLELVTKNYQPDRLKHVLDELNIHWGMRYEDIYASLLDKIELKLKEYYQLGKPIPYRESKIPHEFGGTNDRSVDVDKLFDYELTWQLYPLNELKGLINSKLKQSLSPPVADPVISPRKRTDKPERDFSFYLTDKGKRIIPQLQDKYVNGPKLDFAKMIIALDNLGILINYSFASGHLALYKALVVTFGDIGSRPNFDKYRGGFRSPGDMEREEIQAHEADIKRILDLLNS